VCHIVVEDAPAKVARRLINNVAFTKKSNYPANDWGLADVYKSELRAFVCPCVGADEHPEKKIFSALFCRFCLFSARIRFFSGKTLLHLLRCLPAYVIFLVFKIKFHKSFVFSKIKSLL